MIDMAKLRSKVLGALGWLAFAVPLINWLDDKPLLSISSPGFALAIVGIFVLEVFVF